MTGKERAELRKQANTLQPIFQVGKGDIGDTMIESVDEALQKRELIKIAVLESSELTARDAADILSIATQSDVIQCIGRKFVLYRYNPDNHEKK